MSRSDHCPVGANCRVPTHCPYCVAGSEYQPRDRSIPWPATATRVAAAHAARAAARQTPAAVRGRRAARKGRRLEQEAARVFGGQRVPLSGALDGLANDVVFPNGWRAEVKGRAQGFAWLYAALATHAWVVVRDGTGRDLYAVTGDQWRLGFPPPVRGTLRRTTWAVGDRPGNGWGCTRSRLTTVWRWLAAEAADVLLFKADRQAWLVLMDQAHWDAWLGGAV